MWFFTIKRLFIKGKNLIHTAFKTISLIFLKVFKPRIPRRLNADIALLGYITNICL